LTVASGTTLTKIGGGTMVISGPQNWGAGCVFQIGGSGPLSPEIAGTYSAGSVPEPATPAMLAAGGLCLLAYAWRRRKRAA
jgi:hypothetical protein